MEILITNFKKFSSHTPFNKSELPSEIEYFLDFSYQAGLNQNN